uniref:RNA-directed DNA polymerase n=2 Tax=Lygus hesperus TaxID=30085 RepID=A0A146L0H7_LYGHE
MASNVPIPAKMTTEGNASEHWKYFKEEWENYAIASGLDKKEPSVQVATLKCLLGRGTMQILKNLKLDATKMSAVSTIVSELDAYFSPAVNIIYERYIFGSAVQGASESIDQYVARLRNLVSTCSYGSLEGEMIRDRLVLGIRDEATKKQLICDAKLTLDTAITTCRVNELASAQMRSLHTTTVPEQVNRMHQRRKRPKSTATVKGKADCWYCGLVHAKGECPAYGKRCFRCRKYNHLESVCESLSKQRKQKLKSRRSVKRLDESDSSGSEGEISDKSEADMYSSDALRLETVNNFGVKTKRKWVAKLDFYCKHAVKAIDCQLDSGATVNVCDVSTLRKAFGNKFSFQKSGTTIRCFGGSTVRPIGEVVIAVASRKAKCDLVFQVVDNNGKGKEMPLLSAESCEKLGLVQLTADVKLVGADNAQSILERYGDVFRGIGCLEGECTLNVDPNFQPVKQKPRRIPVPLREEVKQKLEELVRNEIITKETGPTDWISNLVVVKTPKKLRLCLDPLFLNRALRRTEYEIPTIESLTPELNGARYFSVVDTKDGFWNLKLSPESSKLTTFWTPFGRYRFLRLPFGLCVSTDMYQCRLHEIFEGLENVIVIQDDILVIGRGSTDEEASINHDRALERLLARAKQANLKFNRDKIKLKQREVRYMGHIITPDGLKADPGIVAAINQMPYPADVTQVKSFMGMAMYLSKFVPHLSALCEPLRALTRKGQEWEFGDEHKRAVDSVKGIISKAPVLAYFDPRKPVILQSDASKEGLGAVILQDGRPVAYASRSLRNSEQQYAQIVKECLSILFACTRFSQLITGCGQIIAHTDHRPLETIFQKSILEAPIQLQRMMMRLQRYDLQVKFISGSKMFLADPLSRMMLQDTTQEGCLDNVYLVEEKIFEEIESIKIPENVNITQVSLEKVRQATMTDDILPLLASVIKEGWPIVKEKLPSCLYEYWDLKDELMVQDGVIFKGNRIVVPKSLRAEFINKIHLCHLGQNASLRRARDTLFWPFMSVQIKDTIKTCQTCQELAPNQTKTPMKTHRIPSLPWERVSMDTFEFENRQYVVIVDAYSDYFEVEHLPNITTKTIIKFCKQQFARHGIPQVLITDNAPQLISGEFREFAQEWEFLHSTSSPHHSRGNGKAESAVKIAKTLMRKCRRENCDFYSALLEWRNTPTVDMESSPAQRLMSRRTRNRIPMTEKLLIPEVVPEVQELIAAKRRRTKFYYDKSARTLPDLEVGQEVLVKPNSGRMWKSGEVEEKHGQGASYDVVVDGKLYRRNRTWLRPQHTSPTRFPRSSVKVRNTPSPKKNGTDGAETSTEKNCSGHQTNDSSTQTSPKNHNSIKVTKTTNLETPPSTSTKQAHSTKDTESAPRERPKGSRYGRPYIPSKKLQYDKQNR